MMPACQAKCRGIWLAPHAERRGLHPNPLVCAWCGCSIEPNAPRARLFVSQSIRAVGRWVAHFHPACGDELQQFCAARQEGEAGILPVAFGDPGRFSVPTKPGREHSEFPA